MPLSLNFQLQRIIATIMLLGLLTWAWLLGGSGEGQALSFSLVLGICFGIVLQRSRFCFFCMTRDFIDNRDSRGLLGLMAALAVGTLGYLSIFGAMLPIPAPGRWPPDAHIGPISWVLALAAWIFGSGMAISGSCISAHFYRLGEGASASIFALIGALLGFVLGFQSWNFLYLNFIQESELIWLPHYFGYGGTAIVQLSVLGLLAIWLVFRHKHPETPDDGRESDFFFRVFEQRWPAYIGGLLLGFIATIAFFRVAPLGVTAELGSVARTLGTSWGWLPERLEGLDSFAGCATLVKDTLLSNSSLFVVGLVAAAWASALSAGQFKPVRAGRSAILKNLSGGLLMGWASMTALGCTVGTLLSGIMAGALSGWFFAVFCFLGLGMTRLVLRSFSTS